MNYYEQINYKTLGYEGLEISTKIIISRAKARGVDVELIDEKANFICLSKNSKKEYVRQASKTRLDNYVSICIMEDKNITKIILEKENISVPIGYCFDTLENALSKFEEINNKILIKKTKFIIKPTTTNFGLGISIIYDKTTFEEYKNYLNIAFSLAEQVIVEQFIEGKEYRFFILEHKCIAVCERIPANVIGDGLSSIEELVKIKNEDPRRGVGHTTPLEKIGLNETEKTYLSKQNLTIKSVPKKNEQIFLRANSNVSTGGEPIDLTDEMPDFFKEVAVSTTKIVNTKICGVDLIIPDLKSKVYSVLELNFNPTIYIHEFPYKGKPRPIADCILDALGF